MDNAGCRKPSPWGFGTLLVGYSICVFCLLHNVTVGNDEDDGCNDEAGDDGNDESEDEGVGTV